MADWVLEAVTPGVLTQVRREFIRNGNSMHVIRVDVVGRGRLIPASKLALGGIARRGTAARVASRLS